MKYMMGKIVSYFTSLWNVNCYLTQELKLLIEILVFSYMIPCILASIYKIILSHISEEHNFDSCRGVNPSSYLSCVKIKKADPSGRAV
jgi:hypothetical protein